MVSLQIHPNDEMCLPYSASHYLSVDLSAIRCIENALKMSLRDKPVGYIFKKSQDLELRMRRILAKHSYLFAYDVSPLLGHKKNIRYYVYATDSFSSLGLLYRSAMPEIEKMYLDFEEVLSGLHSQVQDNGGELLVVLFPTRIQVSKKDWKLLTRFYALDRAKFDLDYSNNRIGIFCKEHNINCLDLLIPFRQRLEKSNSHLYRSMGDMHFNEEGQELAAEKIAEWVLGYGLVKH